MKKSVIVIFTLLLVTLFFSCTSDEGLPKQAAGQDNERSTVNSRFRTISEAIDIVNESMSLLDDGNLAKTRSSRSISMNDTHIVTSPITRSGETDTLLYILNFDNEAGYAVVSANRQTEALLAITDQGNYSGNGSVNPGAQMFIDKAMAYSSSNNTKKDSLAKPVIPDPRVQVFRTHSYDTTLYIKPRIKLRLGQKWPEGSLCPNYVSCCAVTAAAMIMGYYQTPAVMPLTYPERTSDQVELDWTDINKHIGSAFSCDLLCEATDNSHIALAQLCRQLGYQSDVIYEINDNYENSSKFIADNLHITRLFHNSGLRTTNLEYYARKNSLYDIKHDGILFFCGGWQNEQGLLTNGHAWLVDGGLYYTYTIREYRQTSMMIEPELVYEDTTEYNLMHVNWGWNGDSNGYYSDGVFNTSLLSRPDPGVGQIDKDNPYVVNYRRYSIITKF